MIETKALQRHYKLAQSKVKAVDDLSLSINEGEFVSIMGPSGSGKSTLLYMLGAMDRPTDGWIKIYGKNLAQMNDHQLSQFRNRSVGFVFQSFHLLPRLTLSRNIALPMMYAKTTLSKRTKRISSLLKAVSLTDMAQRYPTELSGGQCQRVAIARALANSPKLLLADEPTGNLDSRTGLEIMGIFQKLNDYGMTFIMVTHDENMANHATRILRMKDGKVICDDKVRKRLRVEPSADFKAELIEGW